MPLMTSKQLSILGAVKGAHSIVTKTEATHDRAVTVDRFEKQALFVRYQLSMFTRKGGAHPDKKPDRMDFRVHPRNALSDFSVSSLAVKFPKSNGNELRIYNSEEAGFAAKEGDVFYIFSTAADAEPHVGYVEKLVWDEFWANPTGNAAAAIAVNISVDTDDEFYQRAMESVAARIPVATTGMRYPTDPAVGLRAKTNAKYLCEIDPHHNTFISAATGKSYVEGHHLVPMSVQAKFENSLDVVENIISLCPTCHRSIHLAEAATRVKLLMDIYGKRQQKLVGKGINISLGDLLKIYNIT